MRDNWLVLLTEATIGAWIVIALMVWALAGVLR
jgi:uncharacterized MnhB-related membrane protein